MGLAAAGRLRVLRDRTSTCHDGFDIILIPDIGTTSSEHWPFANQQWLATLPDSGDGARVLAYEYPSPFSGNNCSCVTARPVTSWESLLMLGYDLLQYLSEPILMVCHILGGIMAKQALCVANKQFPRYGSIVNSIAGVVFLSTPHRYGDKTTNFNRVEQDGAMLLHLADRFEGISFRTPVLSLSCSTHAPMETVIGLNLSHHDTCLFTQSAGGEELFEFIKFIDRTLQEYQYATMSVYSPTLSELPRLNMASNIATEGTSLSGFEMVHPPTPNTAQIPKIVRLPCFLFNTHSGNDDFCGREDILERVATELLPSKNLATASGVAPLRQFALCGFGGIGKTEISREFARRHRAPFDAVFWCKIQVVSREVVKGWLSNPRMQLSGLHELVLPGEAASEATWLLIFDNADDPMILADYWPQGSGSILLTRRDPLAKSMFTRRPSGLDLGARTQQDSLYMLQHLTTNLDKPEDDTARKIANALGGIPLAISQMAGIIRRQDLTLSEFYELYKDQEEHARLYETKFDTSLVTYRHSLSTVWAFEKLKPQARQLLELVSFLDPDVIGDDLLMKASAALRSDGLPFKKGSYIEARAELLQSSLVQRDKQRQRISVHRIVKDAVLTTMGATKKQAMFCQVVRTPWAGWPSAMPKPSKEPELPPPKSTGGRLHVGRWPECAAIYPHVLRMHQIWSGIPDLPQATRLLFAKLLTEAREQGQQKDFDGFFETARAICESSTHPDRDSVLADVYFCLASIAMDSSDFATSRVYKERSFDLALKICQELGTEEERLYLAYAERAISRIQDRRYAEGEADLKEGLRIRKALGNYIPRSGEANPSYALVAQGKLEECNTLLLDSLDGRERVLGKDDREGPRTGPGFGNLRAAQSRRDESFEYHHRAWRHMRSTVGDRDFYTASATHKIPEHLFRLGRSGGDHAGQYCIGNWSIDPTAHKPEIARTTFLKGKLFEASEKEQKASIAMKVAARLWKEVTKEDRDPKSLMLRACKGTENW
ncbi:hypothetical protein C8A05DRAFT_40822 [Staphylotrichum tortipilum]|uniref:DUF7779 domain-containing protein n=1 Tax=Staphylotrichum tortipilum TaxID=2831512 RepID=A0AAN6MTJ9_9PEZI|nr:hypothetical protein C8A05DRAFT_40822 [Staphylotrichum longicolle]